MPEQRLMDSAGWRSFRLFLIDLEDAGLQHVQRQLQGEIARWQECETDFTRLFFSSLQPGELETAQKAIGAEFLARVQDRRKLRSARRR